MLGALLAGAVAVGLSPLTPLGPVRRVETSGVAFDWTVLGLGVASLILVLSAVAVAIAYRQAPHRVARRHRRAPYRGSRAARAAANAGLPTPTVTGIRFAVEPGAGSNAVPVRSAIIGAVLAIVVVTSTVTFGASLRTLVSRPALYGWNWNYELLAGFSGQENLPRNAGRDAARPRPLRQRLDRHLLRRREDRRSERARHRHEPELARRAATCSRVTASTPRTRSCWARAPSPRSTNTSATPSRSDRARGSRPPCTSSEPPPCPRSETAARDDGYRRPTRLAALLRRPTQPTTEHHPRAERDPDTGPQDREPCCRAALTPTDQRHHQQRVPTAQRAVSQACSALRRSSTTDQSAPRPRCSARPSQSAPSPRSTLTLITSVRRRRRELALLKTLGFTRRQLAAVVAWQSTIAVAIGIIIGVPVGISHRAVPLGALRARDPRRTPPNRPHAHDRAHRLRAHLPSPTSSPPYPDSKQLAPAPRSSSAMNEPGSAGVDRRGSAFAWCVHLGPSRCGVATRNRTSDPTGGPQ